MYNSCNLNPCGRVFNNHDVVDFSDDAWLITYFDKHHLKMIKHLLASVKMVSNYRVLTPIRKKLEEAVMTIEESGANSQLVNDVIEDIHQALCCLQ